MTPAEMTDAELAQRLVDLVNGQLPVNAAQKLVDLVNGQPLILEAATRLRQVRPEEDE